MSMAKETGVSMAKETGISHVQGKYGGSNDGCVEEPSSLQATAVRARTMSRRTSKRRQAKLAANYKRGRQGGWSAIGCTGCIVGFFVFGLLCMSCQVGTGFELEALPHSSPNLWEEVWAHPFDLVCDPEVYDCGDDGYFEESGSASIGGDVGECGYPYEHPDEVCDVRFYEGEG